MAATSPHWSIHLPAGSIEDTIELTADGNLPRRWARHWQRRGSVPTLQDVDGTWLGAAELEQRTRHGAHCLLGAGLEPGDRLLLLAGSSARLIIAYAAALRAGLTVVPVNPAYTDAEIAAIARDCQPAAAIVDGREHPGKIFHVLDYKPRLLPVSLDLPDSAQGQLDQAAGDDPALLIYTSGTTGRPKGVPLSHDNLLASATAVNLAWRWQPDDCLLLTLPLFHVHGLGVGVNGSLCAGAAVMLRAGFDVAAVAEDCQDSVTLFFGVPTMYQRLARAGAAPALRSLRLLVSGSAPLPAALAEEIAVQAGQIPLERYGMTETVMLTGNPYDGPRRPGTVGFPFPGVDLRLTDSGEVEVRGPNVISGYFARPQATAEAFSEDGWFRTGDLGELDGDGYLRLVGRAKELIISGGYNVYPREVEEVLAEHPAVREVAVIGRPSEQWGEEVTAVVISDGDVALDELRAFAAQRLAPYKVPKRVEHVGQLPRNALGKVPGGL